jgi:hypothetical protein
VKSLLTLLLATSGLFVSVAPLRADFVATATMTAAEDGATNSNGSGSATVTYNMAANDFTYTLSWSNLTGDATMAHIHNGAPGVAGPVIVPFFMMSMPATGSMSGTLTQADVTPANGINTIADVAAAIEAGNAYVNVHTAEYPGGEIRGQLAVSSAAVPEPMSIGLLLLGAGVAAGLRREAR